MHRPAGAHSAGLELGIGQRRATSAAALQRPWAAELRGSPKWVV